MNGFRRVCRRQRGVLQGKQEEDTSPEPQQETTEGVTAQERLPGEEVILAKNSQRQAAITQHDNKGETSL
jgi:hypothetical protein